MGRWFRAINFINRSRQKRGLFSLSQAGQGTVEYVLVLVVSVALVLAVSSKIYKPMGEFANSYMSDYLGCLLDLGILPKLGSDDDGCAESLKLSAGNPLAPRAGGSSKSGSGGSGSGSGDTKADKNKKNSSEQDEMAASRAGQPKNGGRIGALNSGRSRRGDRGSDAARGNDQNGAESAAALKASKFNKVSSRGGGFSGPKKMIQVQGLGGLLAKERAKLKRREDKISKAGVVESSEDLGKPKKLLLKPPERKVAAEAQDEPWDFSRLIRFAIIIMILIAIFVFLSGQAVQISKSWEK